MGYLAVYYPEVLGRAVVYCGTRNRHIIGLCLLAALEAGSEGLDYSVGFTVHRFQSHSTVQPPK